MSDRVKNFIEPGTHISEKSGFLKSIDQTVFELRVDGPIPPPPNGVKSDVDMNGKYM